MIRRGHGEEGQAAPLYITAVVGLLFLALLYFVFGKADIRRNEAQTAADAAALAAAMDSRNGLKAGLLDKILDPDSLADLIRGDVPARTRGCDEAYRFAELNGAQAGSVACDPLHDGRWGFAVELKSGRPVGDSVLPGTRDQRATATATAIVEPLCTFRPNEDAKEPEKPGDEDDTPGEDEESPSPGTIQCDDGEDWIIDPDDLDLLPDMADLFRVRLAGD
ncbi:MULTISPECIES: pilus assembly protein TadG-related protein [unclassified Streptomyces]|uniref:pilus assembly protein TadG-related protein n=1 Tax=unclassified Streptomyces TaxID=2593676 RepID=UPI001D04B6B3|nr:MULTISPECIES: pilus assembly protein TadG-related protein [unclassified Streptomyces]